METTLKRDSTVLKLEDLNQRCDLFLQVCVRFMSLIIFFYYTYIGIQSMCVEQLQLLICDPETYKITVLIH